MGLIVLIMIKLNSFDFTLAKPIKLHLSFKRFFGVLTMNATITLAHFNQKEPHMLRVNLSFSMLRQLSRRRSVCLCARSGSRLPVKGLKLGGPHLYLSYINLQLPTTRHTSSTIAEQTWLSKWVISHSGWCVEWPIAEGFRVSNTLERSNWWSWWKTEILQKCCFLF